MFGKRPRHFDAPEKTGRQDALGVRNDCPYPHRAGGRINPVLGEIKLARKRREPFVRQPYVHIKTAAAFLDRAAARAGILGIGKEVALVDVEIEVDGVDRHNGRQHRFIRAHKVSGGHALAVDATCNRGADQRKIKVDLRLLQGLLGLFQRTGGVEEPFATLVHHALGDVAIRDQALRPRQLFLREAEAGFGIRDFGLGLPQGNLEQALVDGEQDVALVHERSVREIDRFQITRHARPDIDRVRRLEPTDEFVLLDDGFHDGGRDGDFGRRVLRQSGRNAGSGHKHKTEEALHHLIDFRIGGSWLNAPERHMLDPTVSELNRAVLQEVRPRQRNLRGQEAEYVGFVKLPKEHAIPTVSPA